MSSRSARRAASEYTRVLTNVFEFMYACGLGKGDIQETAARALKKVKVVGTSFGRDMSGGLATAALVLDAWHRDRRYLTLSGRPRAVPLLGPAPSVEALIRGQSGRHRASALARRLKLQRFVVSSGAELYKPASNIALLSAFDPLAIQHVARSLSMMLETIRQNLAGPHASQRLIERIAEVPDLPLKHVQAFRKFTQAQGWILLRTVNDWLEARRVKDTTDSQDRVRAGIHVYTYVGGSKRAFDSRKSNRFRV